MRASSKIENLVIALTDGLKRQLHVVDARSGATVVSVTVGAYPTGLIRSVEGELLVSEIQISDPSEPRPILSVFDIASGQRKWSIPLPDRANYSIFSVCMSLSARQRHLYYLKRTPCPGVWCDDYAVGIVDLDAQVEVATAPLPRNGGAAHLIPSGLDDAIAMCPDVREVYRLTPDGSVTLWAHFPSFPLPEIGGDGYLAWPVFGGIVDDESAFMVFEDGTLHIRNRASDLVAETRLVADDDARFSGILRWVAAEGQAVLGFRSHDDNHRGEITGAVIINAANPLRSERLSLPSGTRFLTPIGLSAFATLQEGRLSVIDRPSGARAAGPFAVPLQTEWLISTPQADRLPSGRSRHLAVLP